MKLIKTLIALVLLTLALIACGSSQANTGTAVTPTPTTKQQQPTDTPTPKPTHFKIGDTVKVGDVWTITITKIRTEQGGQYDPTPTSGNTYLVISIAAKNISSTEQQFYGSAGFTLRDPSGQSFQASYVSDARQAPMGKAEPGGPLSGDIVYEVSKSTKHYTLSSEQNAFMPGQVVWDITV
jgi:hypothetical protein